MSDIREQGRPRRGDREVGKDKILAAMRSLLRSEKSDDLSRKAVAAYARVTPALISYYFPRKEQLLEEAVTPIVTAYADEIISAVNSPNSDDERMRQIISILVRLYKQDGKLIDLYYDLRRSGTVPDQMARMTSALAKLFGCRHDDPGTALQFDAVILQGAIWGICRFAARVERDAESTLDHRFEGLRGRVAEALMSLPLRSEVHGIEARGILASVSAASSVGV